MAWIAAPGHRAFAVRLGLLEAHLAHDAVGVRELRMRAGADAQVVAESPVVDVVAGALYSGTKILSQFNSFDQAFAPHPHTICYAMKANGNLAVLRLLARAGAGADIVSGGELYRAMKAGVPPSRIVFSGVGKTENEMLAALKAGILMFNVESSEEMEALARTARRFGKPAPLSLRVNPNVAVNTRPPHHNGESRKQIWGHDGPSGNAVPSCGEKPLASGHRITGPYRVPTLGRPALSGDTRQIASARGPVGKGRYLFARPGCGGGLGVVYKDEKAPRPAQLAEQIPSSFERPKNAALFLDRKVSCGGSRVLVYESFVPQGAWP